MYSHSSGDMKTVS